MLQAGALLSNAGTAQVGSLEEPQLQVQLEGQEGTPVSWGDCGLGWGAGLSPGPPGASSPADTR